MWWSLILLTIGILGEISMGQITSSNYFCTSLNPQPQIIIEQLMGIWYGIEIISHNEMRYNIRYGATCPIIHISEDKSDSTMYNPLYRSNYYGYNNYNPYYNEYDARRLQNYINETQRYNHPYQQQYPNQYNNNQRTGYGLNYDNSRRYGQIDYRRRENEETKRLRLFWDENGISKEYKFQYNVSSAGFWISAGPQNGFAVQPPEVTNHFIGIVQVIKAVGNHLVLTFCRKTPNKEFYSILLSRENNLDELEINGVHKLLTRKRLSINSVKKVCNNSNRNIPSLFVYLVTIVYLFHKV